MITDYKLTYNRKVAPRLSVEAAEKLSSHFVSIRKKVHIAEQQSNERSTIPITVRQLEAIIRMTESIAKIHLRTEATEADADEAIRLFLASTMDAFGRGQTIRQELYDEITKIESGVRKRLPMGWSTNYSALAKEFITNVSFLITYNCLVFSISFKLFFMTELTFSKARVFARDTAQSFDYNGEEGRHSSS